jgi:hypothetical protein
MKSRQTFKQAIGFVANLVSRPRPYFRPAPVSSRILLVDSFASATVALSAQSRMVFTQPKSSDNTMVMRIATKDF